MWMTHAQCARHAIADGMKAFYCTQHDGKWQAFPAALGVTYEYAEAWLEEEKPDYVHHIEITPKKQPVLVVTCFKDELPDDIPPLFKLEPITPELWEKPRVRSTSLPAGHVMSTGLSWLPQASAAPSAPTSPAPATSPAWAAPRTQAAPAAPVQAASPSWAKPQTAPASHVESKPARVPLPWEK
jgi:hypothetical protein